MIGPADLEDMGAGAYLTKEDRVADIKRREALAPHERDDPRRIELRRRELERREAAARRIVPTCHPDRSVTNRPADSCNLTNRHVVDAWFHAWTVPASLWLRWVAELHNAARSRL